MISNGPYKIVELGDYMRNGVSCQWFVRLTVKGFLLLVVERFTKGETDVGYYESDQRNSINKMSSRWLCSYSLASYEIG